MRVVLVALLAVGCSAPAVPSVPAPPLVPLLAPDDAPLAGEVDPFVGTANDGQTFPGAVVPWGMASPSPHTTVRGAGELFSLGAANAGYLHGEPEIRGFGLTHLSGVGCPDLGAPVIVPTVGPIETRPERYASAYEDEHAHAGYYAVTLSEPGVHVEATATERTGVLRMSFPSRAGDANVLVDAGEALSWRTGEGTIRVVSPREAEGSTELGLFCGGGSSPTLFFVVRFDHDAVETGTWDRGGPRPAPEASGHAGAFFRFTSVSGEPIVASVGLSWTSTDGARANLEAEARDRTFEAIHDEAARAWQRELARISFEGGDAALHRRVVTALYHALLHPNVLSDADGTYLRGDGTIGTDDEPRYTVFSLWDTYRTVHPLLALAYPERQTAMLRSIAGLGEELGRPPRWELVAEEVNMMVGDPATIVVADSVARGLRDFDLGGLYPRLVAAADDPMQRPAIEDYVALGFVPMDRADDAWGPVSTTLEYALADAALASLASGLGETDDAARFSARAASWRTLFDSTRGLLRPRERDGSLTEPFDPDAIDGSAFQPRSGGPGYVEGTAWQYAFFVPHDLAGLRAAHGDDATFVSRLEAIFAEDRFAMWNEPDVGYPWIFAEVPGEEHRTDRLVAESAARWFGDGPAGIPGNDDAGTLSAWLVLSSIGLYPSTPGTSTWTLAAPAFDRVTIDVGGGRTFTIVRTGEPPYLATATLDGMPIAGRHLEHGAIAAGGSLAMTTAATPP